MLVCFQVTMVLTVSISVHQEHMVTIAVRLVVVTTMPSAIMSVAAASVSLDSRDLCKYVSLTAVDVTSS